MFEMVYIKETFEYLNKHQYNIEIDLFTIYLKCGMSRNTKSKIDL